jgi:hypothetical protein
MIIEKVKVVSGSFTIVTAETEEDRQSLESELTDDQKMFLEGLRIQVARNMNKPLSKQLVQITAKYIDVKPC